ncbi:MAG: capsid protein [Wigfec virus K19_545]|nr:MAG: capsid protein [Wigfec virus K19_545]
MMNLFFFSQFFFYFPSKNVMPYRRKIRAKKRSYVRRRRITVRRKRVYGRKRVTRMSRPSIRSMPLLNPDKIRVKLNYVVTINQTNGLGLLTNYIFRGNSLYDPDQTGTGVSSHGFPEWAAMYSRYRVAGSSIKAEIYPVSGTVLADTQQIILNPTANLTDSMGKSPSTLIEMNYSKHKMFNLYKGSSKINSYMSTRKIFGLTGSQWSQDEYASQTNNNPARSWYWSVAFAPLLSGEVTGRSVLRVKLTYYAEFYDRIIFQE